MYHHVREMHGDTRLRNGAANLNKIVVEYREFKSNFIFPVFLKNLRRKSLLTLANAKVDYLVCPRGNYQQAYTPPPRGYLLTFAAKERHFFRRIFKTGEF